jgi:hypothetical protein
MFKTRVAKRTEFWNHVVIESNNSLKTRVSITLERWIFIYGGGNDYLLRKRLTMDIFSKESRD